ncbi:class I adenylate-forming enzyme family protein [Methylosinus sp. Ce-a6]|uniref:class I adenylate-forming enzyme family protein n=1 Tax=Methylosinus sp. Ce-a6 TaxID=2172005 RepID=UPI00135A555D|nr:class I adenylate-forming enzyme family protein [Methylosinus sp. Ce-a6]
MARVEDFLAESARARPEKIAVAAGATRLSYRDLDRLVDRLAATLARRGVTRGDRVLVFMENSVEAAAAIFAVLRAGAVVSPINPTTKSDKLAYIAGNCEARAIVAHGRQEAVARAAVDSAGVRPPDVLRWSAAIEDENFDARPRHGGVDADLALLVYTSGSTGRPKGVMMTHRNVEAASSSIISYLGLDADDVILSVLPLAFDYGLYQLLMAVRVGATLVLEKSFAFPQATFARIREEAVTVWPLVPTMAAMILAQRELAPGFLPSVRLVTTTAAALPIEHISQLRALLPAARLFSMYGLTECKRCTYLPPEELDRRPGSVGVAIPGAQALVLDENGRPAPPGAIGELAIRGPHVMQGYWGDPVATAERLRRDPQSGATTLMTGDLFRADAEGFLYFVGRKDDIIKTRGEKVAPKEVEAALHACPGISEAVVVGVKDPVLGEAVAALVVASDPALDARALIAHCARRLEDFMVPKLVAFRDALPKTDTGKVSRRLASIELETLR